MATILKSYTDNQYESSTYRKTWVVQYVGTDITASSDTFTFTTPTISASFTGVNGSQATGTYRNTNFELAFRTDLVNIGSIALGNNVFVYCDPENSSDAYISGSSGTFFTATKRSKKQGGSNTLPHTQTLNTASFFTSDNKTQKTIDITAKLGGSGISLKTNTNSSGTGHSSEYSMSTSGTNIGVIGTITLNAPPTFSASALGSDTGNLFYTGSVASTTISDLSAKYGGDITSAVLTIGNQSTSRTDNGPLLIRLNETGTFTPVVTVRDSRGQVSTQNLSSITVGQYARPSLSFEAYRTNSSGVKSDSGTCGLIKAKFTYSQGIATLTKPAVTSKDPNGTVTTQTNYTTWYSSYSDANGVSSAISNWSSIASGSTVYGLINPSSSFDTNNTYQITVTETDSQSGVSDSITQSISSAFYTIDIQAGGKEIAFGAAATDSVSNFSNGLFRCDMTMKCPQIFDTRITNSLSRETTASPPATGKRGVTAFLSSSAMTTDRPPSADGTGSGEGTILHCEWDNTDNGGWNAQLFIADNDSGNKKPFVAVRGMRQGTWTAWDPLVNTSGATMKGQLKTSFQTSVAMGSYGSAQTTVENFINEVRYSSGCSGSVSIGTAYTKNGVTISTGWYNFMYMPHRSGGVNGSGTGAGDNISYGNCFLFGMNNANGRYIIRVSSGSIQEVSKLVTTIELNQTPSTSGLSPYSSRCTISNGGIYSIGNQVFVTMKLKIDASLSANNYWTVVGGFPAPSYEQALACSGINKNGTALSAYVKSDGYLVITTDNAALASGDYVTVGGWYLKA